MTCHDACVNCHNLAVSLKLAASQARVKRVQFVLTSNNSRLEVAILAMLKASAEVRGWMKIDDPGCAFCSCSSLYSSRADGCHGLAELEGRGSIGGACCSKALKRVYISAGASADEVLPVLAGKTMLNTDHRHTNAPESPADLRSPSARIDPSNPRC